MAGTKTRTQRRMERKQALTLLVLVLVVSLASFTLGVIVGRRGAERDMAQHQVESKRIMVAEVPTPQASTDAEPKTESPPAEEEKLTFYDNLSRGETAPLGSGINLPPEEKKPTVAPPVQGDAEVPAKAPASKTAEIAVANPEAPAEAFETNISEKIPPATESGTYSVQVGSFSSVADAGRFKKTLQGKGYSVFIAEADLGAKGIWYRVRLGPYADSGAAKKALAIASKKDNIKGFVSRL